MPLEKRIEDSRKKAVEELAEVLLRDCEEMLSVLDRLESQLGLSPAECLRLLYQLGELELDDWSLLPHAEIVDFRRRVINLEARLRAVLTKSEKRQELLVRLASGILTTLAEMRRAYKKIVNLLASGELETTLPSIELNADLLSWRDYLGYALSLLEKLGLDLDSKVSAEFTVLDQDMRKVLPRIVGLYREAGDDPTPYPDQFPKSFWWRQI